MEEKSPKSCKFVVYVDESPEEVLPDFTAAAMRAQTVRDDKKVATAVERVTCYRDNTIERKVVAKFDPEPEPIRETVATTVAEDNTARLPAIGTYFVA